LVDDTYRHPSIYTVLIEIGDALASVNVLHCLRKSTPYKALPPVSNVDSFPIGKRHTLETSGGTVNIAYLNPP
jgi:hypothetical protein